MNFQFNDNIRFSKINNEFIVGDIFKGSFVILTEKGLELVKDIMSHKQLLEYNYLSNDQKELLDFFVENNYFKVS